MRHWTTSKKSIVSQTFNRNFWSFSTVLFSLNSTLSSFSCSVTLLILMSSLFWKWIFPKVFPLCAKLDSNTSVHPGSCLRISSSLAHWIRNMKRKETLQPSAEASRQPAIGYALQPNRKDGKSLKWFQKPEWNRNMGGHSNNFVASSRQSTSTSTLI